MKNVVIIDSVRTAVGRLGGAMKDVEVDHLASTVLTELVERTGIEKNIVNEVIMGHGKQSADFPNFARVALLRAGFPIEVTGYTVQRNCGSGLQAINNGAQQIMCGLDDVVIAGGAESMSTAPFYFRNIRYGLGVGNVELLDSNTESQARAQPIDMFGSYGMGVTAENLSEQYNISRTEQDEFALRSQDNAKDAINKGLFAGQIATVEIKQKKGEPIKYNVDEHPRETTFEKLSKLKPVFKENGTVTAGNSSGRNDGAAAILLMDEEVAKRYGKKPKARIISQAVAGVRPEIMGIGPAPATRKALQQTGLKLEDIGLIELNEAFAAQSLAVIKELELDINKVNVNGGAIALGHPIGGTGAIIMTKLLHEMERRGEKYGLATLCIGGGIGISTIVENLQV